MKKIFLAFLAASALFLQGCEGPAGRDGIDGIDGVNILGEVFEIKASFNKANDFKITADFPSNVGDKGFLFDEDVVLIYHLERTTDSGLEIWEKLGQPRYLSNGRVYHYGYDFSYVDYSIFMNGNFDLSTLPANATNERWFRIVIVPAKLVGTVNPNSIKDVMGKLNISESDVKRNTPILHN